MQESSNSNRTRVCRGEDEETGDGILDLDEEIAHAQELRATSSNSAESEECQKLCVAIAREYAGRKDFAAARKYLQGNYLNLSAGTVEHYRKVLAELKGKLPTNSSEESAQATNITEPQEDEREPAPSSPPGSPVPDDDDDDDTFIDPEEEEKVQNVLRETIRKMRTYGELLRPLKELKNWRLYRQIGESVHKEVDAIMVNEVLQNYSRNSTLYSQTTRELMHELGGITVGLFQLMEEIQQLFLNAGLTQSEEEDKDEDEQSEVDGSGSGDESKPIVEAEVHPEPDITEPDPEEPKQTEDDSDCESVASNQPTLAPPRRTFFVVNIISNDRNNPVVTRPPRANVPQNDEPDDDRIHEELGYKKNPRSRENEFEYDCCEECCRCMGWFCSLLL